MKRNRKETQKTVDGLKRLEIRGGQIETRSQGKRKVGSKGQSINQGGLLRKMETVSRDVKL